MPWVENKGNTTQPASRFAAAWAWQREDEMDREERSWLTGLIAVIAAGGAILIVWAYLVAALQ